MRNGRYQHRHAISRFVSFWKKDKKRKSRGEKVSDAASKINEKMKDIEWTWTTFTSRTSDWNQRSHRWSSNRRIRTVSVIPFCDIIRVWHIGQKSSDSVEYPSARVRRSILDSKCPSESFFFSPPKIKFVWRSDASVASERLLIDTIFTLCHHVTRVSTKYEAYDWDFVRTSFVTFWIPIQSSSNTTRPSTMTRIWCCFIPSYSTWSGHMRCVACNFF